MKYLDPKNDLTFKKIFRDHPDLLISFLNALLPLEAGQVITSLEYLSAEQVPRSPDKKNTTVDVKCKDNKKRQFIVEMQGYWSESFRLRTYLNAAKAYSSQIKRGSQYMKLMPVYALSLVNSNFTDYEDYYHYYPMTHYRHPEDKLKFIEVVFIELRKFKPISLSDKKIMILWLRFLTEIRDGASKISEDLKNHPEIGKASEILEESSFTPQELEVYDRYWDDISMGLSLEEEHIEKGIERGIEKGIEKGRAEGIEKGRAEGIEKKEIESVLGLYKENISSPIIAKALNISEKRVQEIIKLGRKR